MLHDNWKSLKKKSSFTHITRDLWKTMAYIWSKTNGPVHKLDQAFQLLLERNIVHELGRRI